MPCTRGQDALPPHSCRGRWTSQTTADATGHKGRCQIYQSIQIRQLQSQKHVCIQRALNANSHSFRLMCTHTHRHTDTQTHTQMNNHTQMHNAYNCKIISSLRLSPSSACPSRHFVSLHLLLQRALETTIVLTSYILNPNQCSINTKSHTHTKQPLQFQRATVFAGR